MAEPDARWHAHPRAATAIRALAYLLPIVISVLASLWVARRLPTPSSTGELVLWWVALSAVALIVATALERVARRLLPLAVLFQMSLIFPDGAPSRYRLAAKGTSTRTLEREIEEMKALGDYERGEAAERVLRLVAALSKHDPRTRGHAERVAVFSDMIADELDLGDDDRDKLKWAAVLHDVGKLAVHPDILNKPGRPSEEEWETLKQHPVEGARITAPLHEWLGDWSLCIEQHHERWDGKGYPYGLEGEQLAFGARILGVADAYDTITAARSYKKPMPASKARQELAACAGTQFDPVVVRAFMNISLGKLRWAMGPLAWVAQVPAVRSIPGSAATAATAAAAAATAVIAVGAIPTINVGNAVVTPPPVVEPSDEPVIALPGPSPTPEATPSIEPPVVVPGPDGPVLVVPTPTPTTPVPPPVVPTPPAPTPPPATTPPVVPPPVTPPPVIPTPTPTPTPLPGPGFTPGGDVTAVEDAGAVLVPGWASDITPVGGGSFTATPDDPSLFAGGPSVDPVSGDLTFTLADDATGTSTVVVTLTDPANPDAPPATGSFSVTVEAVNDEPSFTSGGNVTVNQDAGAQAITGWASDISAGPPDEADQGLTFAVTSNNPGLFAAGPSIDAATGTLTFTPAPGGSGTATVTVTLTDDGDPVGSATSVFTITVTPAPPPTNQPPSFTGGGNQTVNEDAGPQTVAGWASGISPGPADESGQTVTFTVTNDNNALFAAQPDVDEVSGNLTYEPAADANGVANVTVTLTDDGTPAESTSLVFTITVNPVNDDPVFQPGAPQSSDEDAGPQSVAGWATAISPGPADESGQTVTFTVTNDNTTLFSVQPALAPDGTLTWTSAPDANGTANLTITAQDDGTPVASWTAPGTYAITITAVNDAPSFTAGPDVAAPRDAGPVTRVGWATDISPGPANESGQVLTFNVVTVTNSASFTTLPAIDPTSGNLTFEVAAGTDVTSDVTVELVDDGLTTNGGDDTSPQVTFRIDVMGTNANPTFTPGGDQFVLEDAGAQVVAGWATAISAGPSPAEDGQTVTFLVSNDNNPLFSVQPAIAPDGTLTYTPADDANGTASVTVQAQDDGTPVATSAVETFRITVTPDNDPPSFTSGGNVTVDEDDPAQTIPGWATDISPGGGPDEAGQTLTFTLTGYPAGLFSVAPAIDPVSGDLTFTPAPGANGAPSITVTLDDGAGDTASSVFTLTVTPENDAPTFTVGATQNVTEDDPAVTVPGWATGITPGDGPDEAGQAVTFNVTAADTTLFAVQPAVNSAGDLTYTLAADAVGSTNVTISATDDGTPPATSPTQNFTINVAAENDAPTFTLAVVPDVDEDAGAQTVSGFVSAVTPGGGADESGQLVTFGVTNNAPALFSVQPFLNGAGDLLYTPAPDAFGPVTVTVTGTDDGTPAASTVQTASFSIDAVNDAPSFTGGGNVLVDRNAGAVTISGWATGMSAGPANEVQTLDFLESPTNATLFAVAPSIDPTSGDLTFTVAPATSGVSSVTVELQDDGGTPNGGADTSTPIIFTITVNSAPVGQADSYATDDNVLLTVPAASGVLANDTDPDGDAFTVDLASIVGPSDGTLSINADGSFTYDPDVNFVGTDSFTYQPQDALQNGGDVTVTIEVRGPGIVISEYAYGDLAGTDQDFIELYNAGPDPITMTGWELHLFDDTGLAQTVTIPAATTLTSGQHWLFGTAAADGGLPPLGVAVDQEIPDAGLLWPARDDDPIGIGVWDGLGYVDLVGNRARPVDGAVPAAALPVAQGLGVPPVVQDNAYVQSYERRNGGAAGNCVDTDDNSADFLLNVAAPTSPTANPQNSSSTTSCGTVGPSTHAIDLVISEFRADGPGGVEDDFIEIFNPTPRIVDLTGLQIEGGVTGDYTFPGGTLAPGQHFLLVGAGYTGTDWDVQAAGDLFEPRDQVKVKDPSRPPSQQTLDEVDVDTGLGPPALPEVPGQMDRSYARRERGCSPTSVDIDGFEHLFVPTPTTSTDGLSPCPNSAPTGVDDAYGAIQDTPLVIPATTGVLANDTDPDGDALTVVAGSVTDPPNGSVTVNADGSFTYTPDPGYLGDDAFQYVATDGGLDTATVLVGIVVDPQPLIAISELAWSSMAGDGNDFVELYNNGSFDVDISGWELHVSDNSGVVGIGVFANGLTLEAGKHFLVGNTPNVLGVAVDGQSPGLIPSGPDPEASVGFGLWNGSQYIDQVGNRAKTHNGAVAAAFLREPTGLSVLRQEAGYVRSWERLPDTGTTCRDTDDNGADFRLNTTAATVNPANSTSSVGCQAPAAPTPANHLVVSQFRHDGPDPTPVGSGTDDFIEVFNPTSATVDVTNWEIVTFDGGTIYTFNNAADLPGLELQPGEHFLLGGPDFTGPADVTIAGGTLKGTDWIEIRDDGGATIDRVVMDSSGPPALPQLGDRQDHTWYRRDGNCTDTNVDVDDFRYLSPSAPKPSTSNGGALTPCPNNPPTANADAYTAAQGFPLNVSATLGVLVNDSDPDGDALTVEPAVHVVSPAGAGTVAMSPDGSFTFTPAGAFTGDATFTYEATDGTLKAPSQTVTITVQPVTNVVVSELSWGGLSTWGDYIELYNPNPFGIDLDGWKVEGEIAGVVAWTATIDTTTVRSTTVIPAHGHFLVTRAGSAIDTANAWDVRWPNAFAPSLATSFGVALVNAVGGVQDQVGTSFRQFSDFPLTPPAIRREGAGIHAPDEGFTADGYEQSFERRGGLGNGNCVDNGDNEVDFVRNILPGAINSDGSTPLTVNPQNTDAAPTPCATAAFTVSDHPVITEWRPEGPAGNQDDFVEIFNPTSRTINLDGVWIVIGPTTMSIDPLTGSYGGGNMTVDLTGTTLLPGQRALYVGSAYSGGGTPDGSYGSGGPSTNGTVKLYHQPSQTVLDEVFNRRLAPAQFLLPPTDRFDSTWSRRGDGCAATSPPTGVADDFLDFEFLFAPTPMGRADGTTPCPGAVTETPLLGGADRYGTLTSTTLMVDATSGLLSNDADLHGDALTVVVAATTAPVDAADGTTPVGTIDAINADGSFTYTPTVGFEGTVTFTYQVTDGVDIETVRVDVDVGPP